MTTPTSPDRQPKAGADAIALAIDAIAGGDFSRSRLAALSDLDRGQVAWLRGHWQQIPGNERHALVLALAEVADESLDYNFNRVLRVALDDPNPVVRQLAIVNLWEDEGSDLPDQYIRILRSDPSDDVRAAAADALAVFCDAAAEGESTAVDADEMIELFSSIIEDPTESPIVRRRSLGAVAAFSNDSRIDELIRLGMDDEDQAVVAGAVFAMGRTASPRWIPDILEYMQSEDAELRFEAARAAGLMGEVDAVPELGELVYDPDSEVRAAALQALGIIGGPAAVRILREVEQNEDYDQVIDIEDVLDAASTDNDDPFDRQA